MDKERKANETLILPSLTKKQRKKNKYLSLSLSLSRDFLFGALSCSHEAE